MKLNIGCGTDYREGFINIDGSDSLPRVDKVINIATDSLLDYFESGQVDYILANDIIEHHYHWEGVELMTQFCKLLKPGGCAEIRVPDAEYLIKCWWMPLRMKLTYLFGGQDIPQGYDPEMDESRKQFPEFFCHKYGWTRAEMKKQLLDIGYSRVRCKRAKTNFIAYAIK